MFLTFTEEMTKGSTALTRGVVIEDPMVHVNITVFVGLKKCFGPCV